MLKRIRSLLRQANLREEEVSLYLLLLKVRSASLSELQQRSSRSSATTYRTIHRLMERGLVEAVPINKKQCLYQPLPLKALVKTLDTEQRRLRHLELSLQDLDTFLPYIHNEDVPECEDQPLVDVETGVDAFCNAYLNVAEKQSDEFCAIGSSDNFWRASGGSIDSPLERSFVSRRLKNNMYSRVLLLASDDAEKIAENDSKEKRTSRLKKTLPVTSDMLMMSRDSVSYFECNKENPRVVHVRHPEFVRLHKNYFETLWQS